MHNIVSSLFDDLRSIHVILIAIAAAVADGGGVTVTFMYTTIVTGDINVR